MATGQMNAAIHHLRRAALLPDAAGLTDGQLLECFVSRREAAALEALVRRHGPMVWGVCRRILRSYHDAEDAFQATFLVLVRKAASVMPREMLANWLYGVAHQTALKAKATTAKRKGRERQVAEMPEPAVTEPDLWNDLQPLLDQELSRLPDRYRAVIILCDLEGKTRKEAAGQLGVPEGTVAGRLARARTMLAKRLARHGLAVSGGALAAMLSQNVASAGVPTSVVSATIKAASLFAAGHAAAAGLISAKVAALTEGVLKAMLVTKLKVMAAVLVVLGLLAVSSGTLVHRFPAAATVAAAETPRLPAEDREPAKERAREPREQPKEGTKVAGTLQAVDPDKNSVTVSIFSRADGQSTAKTFQVLKDAKILRDGKEAKLSDLKKGGRATLTLSPDQKTVVNVSVAGATISAPLKAVDAGKNTLTVTVETRQGKQDKTYAVAKDAKVTIDGKEAKLADLKAGAVLLLTASADDASTLVLIQTSGRRGNERERPRKGAEPATGADRQKILDKYQAARPDAKALAIYQLDWMPTLKAAKEKAAKEQRPILLIVVTNTFGDLYTGHC